MDLENQFVTSKQTSLYPNDKKISLKKNLFNLKKKEY